MPTLKDALICSENIWITCDNIHCQHSVKTSAEILLGKLGNISLSVIRANAKCEACNHKEAHLTLIAKTPGYIGDDRDFSHLD